MIFRNTKKTNQREMPEKILQQSLHLFLQKYLKEFLLELLKSSEIIEEIPSGHSRGISGISG